MEALWGETRGKRAILGKRGGSFMGGHLHEQRDLLEDVLLRGAGREDAVEAEVVAPLAPPPRMGLGGEIRVGGGNRVGGDVSGFGGVTTSPIPSLMCNTGRYRAYRASCPRYRAARL